jgi:hypothetical protein
MRKAIVVFAVAIVSTLALASVAQAHIVVTGDVKDCIETTAGEKTGDAPFNDTLPSGITVSGTDELVTVTVPAGVTINHICVKTGQAGVAQVNTTVPVVGPTSFTVVKTVSGGGISHLEFGITTGGGTTTSTTGGDTTSTTGGDTTSTTGGDTTSTTGGDTTGSATTGGGGASGGGGGGGGGGSQPSGELPFTGMPVLIPLLLGMALLTGGILFLRRGRHDH